MITTLYQTINPKELDDYQQTQLAWLLRFAPWSDVPAHGKAKVSWRRFKVYYKSTILAMLNEDMTAIDYRGRWIPIVWKNNNIPTQQEWERKSDNYLISVDMRFSPAFGELSTAIFSF